MNEQIIQNPISDVIKKSITETIDKLKIAVPFISSFAKKVINDENSLGIQEKRLVTKFDERNINTFDIPTFEHLLDCGFEICYNNKIHLKLYITDHNTFITSSNLTKGGFENNIELTVKVDSENSKSCEQVFDDLWIESKKNRVTRDLVDENRDKYDVLKKQQKFEKHKIPEIKEGLDIDKSLIQLVIDEVFSVENDYSKTLKQINKANQLRNKVKTAIKTQKFDPSLYYSPKGHPRRKDNLFHNFTYGIESELASTGLWEAQFRTSFQHKDFKKVINFLIPESIGLEPWNLNNSIQLSTFCNGLFDYKIPQYSEALPIRLASFIYPEYFLPIFKLNHLEEMCNVLRIETTAKTKGEKLYAYNLEIQNKIKDKPFDNYIKSDCMYQIFYCVKLYNRMKNGEDFDSIKNSYSKEWIRKFLDSGKLILEKIKVIN